ncbi:peptide ABC transporter substrate-binding protein [Pleomorphochaeta sp. DL1XJH-081]|uniref:peptide ABC transporter substrate-binding protein n=1 Tax=Pleomorphochaeta sp. DL1XJH-081 TaxID=3409690 RepID=UPI003BB7DBDC
MKRFLLIPVLLLFFTVALFSRGTRETEPLPSRAPLKQENTFSIALIESEDTIYLDPIRATDASSLMILDGLFEGLYSLDPKDGEPILALAKHATVSNDGLMWTFELKEDIRFSNGDPITAESIADSWIWLLEQSQKGTGNTYLISMLDCIEGVEQFRTGSATANKIGISTTDNPQTITLKLSSPAPYLPKLLSMLPLSAIHPTLWKDTGVIAPQDIISSGPYVVGSFEDKSIILEKHPWYSNYLEVPSDYVQFSFMDPKAIIDAYLDRKVHWALAYIPQEQLTHPDDMRISAQYSTGFYYFSAENGPYANPKIRRALDLLIPWDEIRVESRQLFPTDKLIPNGKVYEGKPDSNLGENELEAYALLAEEGFPYGAGLPPLHMAVHRGSQVIQSAERISEILTRKLGMTVVLDSVPLSTYSRYPELSPYELSFITWIGDFHDPFAFLYLFSGESGYNLGKLHDETFDRLLGMALKAENVEERMRFTEAAESYLLENSLVFPLYHGFTINTIQSDRVTGWYANILDFHPIKYLGIN